MIKLERVKKSLKPLKTKYDYDTVLYGSAVNNTMRPTSDVEIAVLTYSNDREENMEIQWDLFGIAPLIYDIRVFELFPIYIRISIIENYQVIFGNNVEISEYFYKFRKKWDDCKHRILSNQFESYKERLALMRNR